MRQRKAVYPTSTIKRRKRFCQTQKVKLIPEKPEIFSKIIENSEDHHVNVLNGLIMKSQIATNIIDKIYIRSINLSVTKLRAGAAGSHKLREKLLCIDSGLYDNVFY